VRKVLTLTFLLFQISCSTLIWNGVNSSHRPGDAGIPSIPSPLPEPSGTPAPDQDVRRREEYAVYDAIIVDLFESGELQCIVLKEDTTARHLIDEDEKNKEYVRSHLPEVPLEVWDDFLGKNQEPAALQPFLHSTIPVFLISQEEINGIFFQEGDGWERFYDDYPGAQGIMDISQVGFNPGLDQALVYAGNQSNYLAGAGFLYNLEKVGGGWMIRNSVMVWIS